MTEIKTNIACNDLLIINCPILPQNGLVGAGNFSRPRMVWDSIPMPGQDYSFHRSVWRFISMAAVGLNPSNLLSTPYIHFAW